MQDHLNDEVIMRLQKIENLLLGKFREILNFNQAAEYLSISHSVLYSHTCKKRIPFHKPGGKYLYFYKDELDEWVRRRDNSHH